MYLKLLHLKAQIYVSTYFAILLIINSHGAEEVQSVGECNLKFTRPCRSNASLCVPLQNIQDGIIDCPDGSDEGCSFDSFVCADLSDCIPIYQYQDGFPDCQDESDEVCDETQHECLCGYPRCISLSKVGDGVVDCAEGSDEMPIEKENYLCPTDQVNQQDLLRKKRNAIHNSNSQDSPSRVFTNYYSLSPGVIHSTGVLTSTVFSFVNKGTTSEYLTQIFASHIDGNYAQITSYTSRTFFSIPTMLKNSDVNGLVSIFSRTTVTNGISRTIVSRIYHTTIDGAYAQLVETETLGVQPSTANYVTILKGKQFQGTFFKFPEESVVTFPLNHFGKPLFSNKLSTEIVTVTGTMGKFIKEGVSGPNVYSVYTGTYVKNDQTYKFFIGNSPLSITEKEVENTMNFNDQLRETKVLKLKTDTKSVSPSLKKYMKDESNDFVGEGFVNGEMLEGIFLANKGQFNEESNLITDKDNTEMITVTLKNPQALTSSRENFGKVLQGRENLLMNAAKLKGRKVESNSGKILADGSSLNPTRPLPSGIPTYVINAPNQNIGDILLRESSGNIDFTLPNHNAGNRINKESSLSKFGKFNINDFNLGDSEKPTVTYYGFAEFSTTISDTVVIFLPTSQSKVNIPLFADLQSTARTVSSVYKSSITSKDFSTVTTKVFNTRDLYPTGLVSSIGGTVQSAGVTTLFTTLVYGTYVQSQYAQVVRSSSSTYYGSSSFPTPSPTKIHSPTLTSSLISKIPNEESWFNNIFSNNGSDYVIGRSVNSKPQKHKANQLETESSVIELENKQTSKGIFDSDDQLNDEKSFKAQTEAPLNKVSVSDDEAVKYVRPSVHFNSASQKLKEKHSGSLRSNDTNVSKKVFSSLFSDLFTYPSKESPKSVNSQKHASKTKEVKSEGSKVGRDQDKITLQSSLNPEEKISTSYFPRTYYTTYTYFTTYHQHNTSSIVSSLETITNVVLNDNKIGSTAGKEKVKNNLITYWTTFTYWTTLLKNNSTITQSSQKTVSNVVHTTDDILLSVGSPSRDKLNTALPLLSENDQAVVRLPNSIGIFNRSPIDGETETQPFSTIVKRKHDGAFAITPTVLGNVDDERSRSVTDLQSTTPKVQATGVLTVEAGTITENGIITFYTTQYVGVYEGAKYSIDTHSTSTTSTEPPKSINDKISSKAGRVKEITGSIIHGTKTTYYSSRISGTVIGGIYAQKVKSSSRVVTGTSTSFGLLGEDNFTSDINPVPSIESSLKVSINPTPTHSTESLNTNMKSDSVVSKSTSKSKNRLSFPFRTSSKRKTNVLPFIRRTSVFDKLDALSKVLLPSAPSEKDVSVTNKQKSKNDSLKEEKSTKSFRFGKNNSSPIRKFRFNDKQAPASEVQQVTDVSSSEINEKEEQPKPSNDAAAGKKDNLRKFRFSSRGASKGTRSNLPIVRKPKNQAKGDSVNRNTFRFGALSNAEDKPESTTAPITVKPKEVQEKPVKKQLNPFRFINKNVSAKRKNVKIKKPTKTTSRAVVRNPVAKESVKRRRLNRLSSRRRPIRRRLEAQESQVSPVYYLPENLILNFEEIESETFKTDNITDIIVRKKRQARELSRKNSRGVIRRFSRRKSLTNSKPSNMQVKLSPSVPEKIRQPFTLSNPRASSIRQRGRNNQRAVGNEKPQKPLSKSKSRTSLPFRISKQSQDVNNRPARKGFRRPASTGKLKISNRFNSNANENRKSSPRRPSQFTSNRERGFTRKPPNGKSNPIQLFLNRPRSEKMIDMPSQSTIDHILEKHQDLTVTREVPVTTTIPLIEDGQTVEKKVITTSLSTETVKLNEVTETKINGELKLLLSTIENEKKITQIFIQPFPTSAVEVSTVFFGGTQSSISSTSSFTYYSVVTSTAPTAGGEVEDLLKLLILQQQQNPFLAALGLKNGLNPTTRLETRTFVTTVTNLVSTEIPIIFRGKPIRTTVVDSNVETLTTTEITTKTISANLLGDKILRNSNPFNPLLPLILPDNLTRKVRNAKPSVVVGHVYGKDSKYTPEHKRKKLARVAHDYIVKSTSEDEILVFDNIIETPPLPGSYKYSISYY